ncbi:hypothetical protein MMC17_007192 [Xylographa soralifera]|nr:hypothetical protein [Xylographa soralifera]
MDKELETVWNQVMNQDRHNNHSRYDNVSVLLLSWAQESDDLDVQVEVDALAAVFQDTFKYQVQSYQLKSFSESAEPVKKAQIQLNSIVAQWVMECDAPGSLLIVYYAGHGNIGAVPGQLELFGKISSSTRQNRLDHLVWNHTEDLLRPAESDVFEIFDCCFAGNLGRIRGRTRNFEYLAATASNSTTPCPGPLSFTSALIWALKDLVIHVRPFTTLDLVNHIIHRAPDFQRGQLPVLSSREGIHPARFITLEPLNSSNNQKARRSPCERVDQSTGDGAVISLGFLFEDLPTETDITALGNTLSRAISESKLAIKAVKWNGLSLSSEKDKIASIIRSYRRLQHRPPLR